MTKMFNTPLVLLKEIKDYCECNIEAGSIHFHTLIQVLQEGISIQEKSGDNPSSDVVGAGEVPEAALKLLDDERSVEEQSK